MKKAFVARLCLAVATVGLIGKVAAQAPDSKPAAPTGPDISILHVQVLLDHLGFGPGVIDGKGGQSLKAALRGFQEARGLTVTGEIDKPTLRALYPYRAIRPVRTLAVSQADVAGPYSPVPKDPADQAKLKALGYADAMEALSERFHTIPETIAALNPGKQLTAGAQLRFPNTLPTSRDYDAKLPEGWRRTLSSLNVSARQPQGDLVVVDKSEGVLKVMKGDRLVGQFPVTTGSEHDPLPIGNWKITVADYNPDFHYNPELFWDVSDAKEDQLLPPGPNGPVGVIWLDLTKEHYGIHGTPEPRTIGRSESHGCVRLSNWDAARLSLMVKVGTRVRFQA